MNYSDRLDGDYSLAYINTDIDINRLIRTIKRLKKGRFLFYGVAGSGKSLLGAYIAKELGMGFDMVTASDILARYSGESETNIKDMFQESEENNQVLLIDEIGYFISDRRNVAHSWEVSQINEFLTRLELYDGIVIGSTNYELEGYIDQAFYRRFDLKVKFNYLEPSQAKGMFRDTLHRLKIALSSPRSEDLTTCYKKLNAMDKITPADFSQAVRKSSYLYDNLTPAILVDLIGKEVCIKPDVNKRSIGFTTGGFM